ncbi:MAG: bifunctional phosphopantothenoylcysteine decarboxylase/phosphopantothenate--cysteine ligase CoaBC [Xanthomonadales bacterium]|nr:bifunctional phosphopantothenoylcysteine decarboxylase/phosphopantothenate--cysteine ligase CoaBC [Xanthomonadales bacterium]
MAQSLAGRRILLGVSGGIAAYKAAVLVRALREAGAAVRVVMTANAQRFVGEATFQALSGEPVRSSLWDPQAEAAMGHIELARWADTLLVAPASAGVLARLAHGMADDLLTTLALASTAPLVLAPAMNQAMWAHPATRANVATLRARGAIVLGPDSGDQACGEPGPGRMREPELIVAALATSDQPGATARLAGRHLVVSAGPTHEDLDPVRFLGNRSSGRMGFAVAAAAAAAGARVTLVAGPVALATPAGVDRIDVRSAAQMAEAVGTACMGADAYIGAAAVADYRPLQVAAGKIKKEAGRLELVLERTPDILAGLAGRAQRPLLVGFAAETGDLDRYARDKLAAKDLDLVAGNLVGDGRGFEREDNHLVLFFRDGRRQDLGEDAKEALARRLVVVVADLLEARAGSEP